MQTFYGAAGHEWQRQAKFVRRQQQNMLEAKGVLGWVTEGVITL
jgi:hypothetical protein